MNGETSRLGPLSSLRRLFQVREAPILIYIIIMIAVFSVTINGFFSMKNFEIISRQITTIGIVSIGMTLVILTSGFDLSVGAILSFAINIGGQGIVLGWPIWIVYPFMLILGVILGWINGFLITRLAVPALIITLGTMNIYRGITMVITKGVYITPIPSVYQVIGNGYIPFVFFAAVLGFFIYVTLTTRFGRNIFAIGGAEQSALYSGVPVRRYKMIVYIISGFLSALSGLILVGKSGFVQPQAGLGYELNAIAAGAGYLSRLGHARYHSRGAHHACGQSLLAGFDHGYTHRACNNPGFYTVPEEIGSTALCAPYEA